MNAAQVLDHFDRVCDAVDSIPRLRRFILDLAVRGKLVEQDPNDEPASELLKRIRAEKAKRIKDGNFREHKTLPPIDEEETEFDLPEGWRWVRMADVTKLWNGYAFKSGHFRPKGIPVIRIGDLQGGEVVLSDAVCVSETVASTVAPEVWIPPGSLLIAMSGATTGKVAFNRTGVRLLLNQRVGRFEVFLISADFIKFFFETIVARNLSISFGTAIPNLSAQQINETIVPLPPLAEQNRIVAKVDELMALCDRLEAAQAQRESRRDKLTGASLHRLNNGADTHQFREHARFHLRHFPRFITRPEHIQQLRQTILRLAVVGRLTEPDETGPAAHEDLQRVEAKKRELGLRKLKTTDPVSVEEQWCELPSRWVWARWDEITDWITYGFTRPMPHSSKGIPIVTGKNVNLGVIIFESAHRTTEEAYSELNEKDRPKKGDILLTKDGSIGRSAVVDTDQPFCINQSVAVLWLRSCHFDRRFLQLSIDCPQTQEALLAKTEGVAIKHISVVDFGKMVFPLPPLTEQHRIVAKVDELMALCDRLEAQLTTSQTESRHVLEAVLNEALIGCER